MDYFYFVPFVGLAAPFPVWVIEQLLPYPYLVEEIVKMLFVLFVVKDTEKDWAEKLKLVIITAFFFSLTENILYLLKILLVGDFRDFALRFVVTSPMHVLTSVIMFHFAKTNPKNIYRGLAIAIIIHFAFNSGLSLIL